LAQLLERREDGFLLPQGVAQEMGGHQSFAVNA
jgi:hypothetical protein